MLSSPIAVASSSKVVSDVNLCKLYVSVLRRERDLRLDKTTCLRGWVSFSLALLVVVSLSFARSASWLEGGSIFKVLPLPLPLKVLSRDVEGGKRREEETVREEDEGL